MQKPLRRRRRHSPSSMSQLTNATTVSIQIRTSNNPCLVFMNNEYDYLLAKQRHTRIVHEHIFPFSSSHSFLKPHSRLASPNKWFRFLIVVAILSDIFVHIYICIWVRICVLHESHLHDSMVFLFIIGIGHFGMIFRNRPDRLRKFTKDNIYIRTSLYKICKCPVKIQFRLFGNVCCGA